MGLTTALILIAVLCVLLLSGLAFAMSRAKRLRPHRPAGGRAPARLRWRRRQRQRTF